MMKSQTPNALCAAAIVSLLVACGGGPETAVAPPGVDAPPPPFTAEQIRDATSVGRTYVQRMSVGAEEMRLVMRFVEVDADGATVETTEDPGGVPARHRSTWAQLAGHAAQPPDAVRSEAPCEVPAGRYDCIIYEAVVGGVRTRMSFARSLPGMPVRIEQADGERWVTFTVLESHHPGEGP